MFKFKRSRKQEPVKGPLGKLIIKQSNDNEICPIIENKCLKDNCTWFNKNIRACTIIGIWAYFFTALTLAGFEITAEPVISEDKE